MGNLQAPWLFQLLCLAGKNHGILLDVILLANYEAFGIPFKSCIPKLVNGAMTGKIRYKNLSPLWFVAIKQETNLHFIEACDFGRDFGKYVWYGHVWDGRLR